MHARLIFVVGATLLACSSSKPSTGGLPDAAAPDAAPDLMTDVHNCGALGHACGCGSTSCTNGACDSHALADHQGGPVVLALHGTRLYWGNDAAMNVSTIPVDASTAAAVLFPGRTAVRGFAFDDTRIYFTRTNFNIVEAARLDGTGGGNYTNAQERGAAGIATDATNTYWADGGFNTIRRAPLGLPVQAATTIASNQPTPDGLALDADHIYWTTRTTTGQILALAKTAAPGTAPTVLAADQLNPHAIAVVDGFVYWTNQGDGTANTGSVQRVAVTGGTVTTLADHQPGPTYLAVAAGFVYWTDSIANAVLRAPIDASAAATPVATGEPGASGIVATDQCVYFTDVVDGKVGTGSVRSHDLQ
jgi:hypothetical protein